MNRIEEKGGGGSPQEGAGLKRTAHGEIRALIVGDDPDDTDLVEELLSDVEGWLPVVSVSRSYEEGLAALVTGPVDVCLLAHRLGTKTGIDFLREPAVEASGVPVILLAGARTREVDDRALEAGAADCLPMQGLTLAALERSIRYAVERRRQAEARLELHARILGAVGQAVIATNLEGEVIYWNRAAQALYGWSEEEALGGQITELTTPQSSFAQAEQILASFREGTRRTGEFPVRRKDGSTFLALVTNAPILDAEGRPQGVIGVSSDISALKRTESALRERVKEMNLLLRAGQIINQQVKPLEDRLRELVDVLPTGWQHLEVTEARIVLDDLTVATEGFRETPWMLSADIPGEEPGRLDVVLTEERPEEDEGPFLAEEVELLETLARTVSDSLERDRLTRVLVQTVASLAEAVIVIASRNGGQRIRDVNPATERIFGYGRDELVGETTEKLHVDRASFQRFAEEGDPGLETEGVFHTSYPLRRKDGTIFEAEQTVTLLDPEEGLEGGVVSVIRDISVQRRVEAEAQRAEERFGVLSREITDIISVFSPDGTTLYTSPSGVRATGYTPEELENMNALVLVHPDDRPRVAAVLRQIGATPGATVRADYRVVIRTGEVRHFESVARNLLDHPAVGGIVVTSRDVTERIHLDERLRQTQKMEAVGRLAAGVAHDFNNILTVIRAQADLTLLDLDDPSLAAEIELIRDSADRAAGLTSQLLAFSREQVLMPRVVDLGEVVRSMGKMLDRVLGEDISIVYRFADGLPPVEVDPSQLEQVLLNLAVNARDAMPDGGQLTISTSGETLGPEEAGALPGMVPGRYAKLSVADTGAGMSGDVQGHVFEPFFTTKERGRGTGLGLSMAYGVMKQSGGGIHVESVPGSGSRFDLRFPAVTGEPEDLTVAPAREKPVEELTGTVVLVEDDDAVRRVTQTILRRAGFQVSAAPDAESGLELIESLGAVDVVLTDLILPGMSGRTLAEHVRKTAPDLRVVVMSGYDAESPGHRSGLPRDVAFLQKPFTPEGLLGVIRQALTRSGEAGSRARRSR